MRLRILLFGCIILLATEISGQNVYDSIFVNGSWRYYMAHLPTGYTSNNNYPLVLGFHGGQQAATSSLGWSAFAYQSRLSEKADSEGFIMVYPEGRLINNNRSWNAGNCCPPAMNQSVDDVGFISLLLDTLFNKYAIDTTKVYATGSSNGGMLCYRLACELSHRFAAVATNAGSQLFEPCNPTNRIPIISFHSKLDPIVKYEGGMGGAPPLTTIFFPSQEVILQFWSQKNSCQKRDTIQDGNEMDYDFIKVHDCACNVEFHHYATSDGGHSWPGGNPNNNPVSTQIDGTDLLWSFFQQYSIGCATSGVVVPTKKSIEKRVFPNPFSDTFRVINAIGEEDYRLTNVYGQLIWNGKAIEQEDFSQLTSGFYFLSVGNQVFLLAKQ